MVLSMETVFKMKYVFCVSFCSNKGNYIPQMMLQLKFTEAEPKYFVFIQFANPKRNVEDFEVIMPFSLQRYQIRKKYYIYRRRKNTHLFFFRFCFNVYCDCVFIKLKMCLLTQNK